MVTGDVKATTTIIEEYFIKQILRGIVFTTEYQKEIIYNDPINFFCNIRMFTERYISDLSTDFGGRTQANGMMYLGMHRTKKTKALLHWVQDFYLI